MLTRLAIAFLFLSAAGAMAQPAVPAVPPLRSAPAAAAPAAAPASSLDAPPTSDAPTASGAPAAARPAPADPDAPPTSGAPTASGAPAAATASAALDLPAPNVPASVDAGAPAPPALPPTVTKNFPLTAEGNARFLAEYAARPDVKKLDGGVLYRVLHPAEPDSNGPISRGDTVTVTYRGWLIDGQVFDQTKPSTPIQFTLNALIDGWRTALMKMKVGDLWEIVIPADQAYGAEGRPGRIPPNQTLVFVVSLAKVEYAG